MSIKQYILDRTRPLVHRFARAYGLHIDTYKIPYGQNDLIFGDNVSICNTDYFNTRSGKITVGDNTQFCENVMVITGKHYPFWEVDKFDVPFLGVPESGRDIIIGENCFIGSGAIILGGVTIGNYSVVGAGAVVTHDVPAKSFVVGNPAKVKRILKGKYNGRR